MFPPSASMECEITNCNLRLVFGPHLFIVSLLLYSSKHECRGYSAGYVFIGMAKRQSTTNVPIVLARSRLHTSCSLIAGSKPPATRVRRAGRKQRRSTKWIKRTVCIEQSACSIRTAPLIGNNQGQHQSRTHTPLCTHRVQNGVVSTHSKLHLEANPCVHVPSRFVGTANSVQSGALLPVAERAREQDGLRDVVPLSVRRRFSILFCIRLSVHVHRLAEISLQV